MDFYLAQIATVIAKGNMSASKAKKIKVEDFLIKFKDKKIEKEDLEKSSEKSKSFWKAIVGLDVKKRNPPNKK